MEKLDINFELPIEALEEKTVSSAPIFDGKVLHVRLDEISLPDGQSATREYCHHNGAVCVIPLTDEGEVICVRQYRYPFHEDLLEIPAGKLDSPSEDPNDAVRRELREETGAIASKITYLGKYYSSPAILDECIHMYMAQGLDFGDTDFDEDEFIEIVKIPIEKLVEMIMNGEIKDSKTQTAVLKVYYILKKEGKI